MKKLLSVFSLVAIAWQPLVAQYSVYDARANSILRSIERIDRSQLNTMGDVLGVNRDELAVLEAIHRVLGEPALSSEILTGQTASSSSANSIGQSVTGQLSNNFGQSLGLDLSNIGLQNSILGDLEGIMDEIPGYEDFDISNVFKGVGQINTFLNGDFQDFKEFVGDPSKAISDEIKRSVMGVVDSNIPLKEMESVFGRRLRDLTKVDFEGNRGRILGDISKMFFARVMDNITESAQRNEVLAAETEQAYEESANSTTISQQMAAQNRISASNNMIELEKLRVLNDTSAAQVTSEARQLDVLETQQMDRNLDRFLE